LCRNLNALDIKLVEHAKQLFEKKRKELEAAGKLQKLPAPLATAADGADATKTGAGGCWWYLFCVVRRLGREKGVMQKLPAPSATAADVIKTGKSTSGT
jgi:hypothetical protein